MSIVPYGAVLCVACGGRPETHPWAQGDGVADSHSASGGGAGSPPAASPGGGAASPGGGAGSPPVRGEWCAKCWSGYCNAVRPRKPQAPTEAAKAIKGNPKSQARIKAWAAQSEQHAAFLPRADPADPSAAPGVPQSASRKVVVGVEWVEEREPHRVSDLQKQYPGVPWNSAPPCQVVKIQTARHKEEAVVLTSEPSSKPKVRLYCRTEVEFEEHHLTPEAMLRKGQGDEIFQQLLASTRQTEAFASHGSLSEEDLRARLAQHNKHATPASSWQADSADLLGATVDEEVEGSPPPKKHRSGGACSPAACGGAYSPAACGTVALVSPAQKTKSRKSGAAGRPTARAAAPAPRRATKADAAMVPLTVMSALDGTVTQPKVQLGWRRTERPQNKAEAAAQQKELLQLSAAISLTNEDINTLTDTQLTDAVAVVEEKVPQADFPWHTWQQLIRRAAERAMVAKHWSSFVEIVWAWGSTTAELEEVDVLHPKLRDIPCGGAVWPAACGGASSPVASKLVGAEAKAAMTKDLLVLDALAQLMSENATGVPGIRILSACAREQQKPSEGEEGAFVVTLARQGHCSNGLVGLLPGRAGGSVPRTLPLA